MFKDEKTKNFLYIFIANAVTLISGIVTSFVMPKYIGLIEFGYWQLFIFYVGYTGLFQFGFNDGVYVCYGGKNYSDLPREKFRAYFLFLLYFQIAVSIILVLLSTCFISDSNRRIIFILISLNVIILGLTTFFVLINQATKRFNRVSFNTVLSKVLLIATVMICIFFNSANHNIFIAAQTIINLVTLFIYIFDSRDMVIGKRSPIKTAHVDITKNITIGFFIMIGNFMGFLTIGVGRFLVDRLFGMEDFAIYSFATSLLNMIFITIEAITTTVYPYLSNVQESSLAILYERIQAVLTVVVGLSLSAFFVLKIFVLRFLPGYSTSLDILLLLFPTVMYRTTISVLSSNYYRVLKEKNAYTVNNVMAFVSSIILSIAAYKISGTLISVAIASVVSLYLWMLYSDYFFYKRIGVNFIKSHIYQILITILFIAIGTIFEWYLGLSLYVLCNLVLLKIFYHNDVNLIYRGRLNYFKGSQV